MRLTSSMKIRLSTLFVIALLALATLPTSVIADPILRKVTVTGNATIKVVPDEMNWSVQVSINDSTLAKAKERHDASLTAALAYVKGLGDAVKDLQTGGIRFDTEPLSRRRFFCQGASLQLLDAIHVYADRFRQVRPDRRCAGEARRRAGAVGRLCLIEGGRDEARRPEAGAGERP